MQDTCDYNRQKESGERDRKPTTTPPTTPEIMPEKSGAPDASATPKQSGSATRATTMEAGRSAFQLLIKLSILDTGNFHML